MNYFEQNDTNQNDNFLRPLLVDEETLTADDLIKYAPMPVNVTGGLIEQDNIIQKPVITVDETAPLYKPTPTTPELLPSPLEVKPSLSETSVIGGDLVKPLANLATTAGNILASYNLAPGAGNGGKIPGKPTGGNDDNNNDNNKKFLPLLIIAIVIYFTFKK